LQYNEVRLAIDRSEIRKALGNFATGVSVITTRVGGQVLWFDGQFIRLGVAGTAGVAVLYRPLAPVL